MDFSCTLIVLWLLDVWDTATDSYSYFNSNDWGRIVNPKKEIANGKQRGQSHDRQRKTGR